MDLIGLSFSFSFFGSDRYQRCATPSPLCPGDVTGHIYLAYNSPPAGLAWRGVVWCDVDALFLRDIFRETRRG